MRHSILKFIMGLCLVGAFHSNAYDGWAEIMGKLKTTNQAPTQTTMEKKGPNLCSTDLCPSGWKCLSLDDPLFTNYGGLCRILTPGTKVLDQGYWYSGYAVWTEAEYGSLPYLTVKDGYACHLENPPDDFDSKFGWEWVKNNACKGPTKMVQGYGGPDFTGACCAYLEALCGNGIIDPGEECDGGFGCGPNCKMAVIVPVCGNGVKEGDEQCDGGPTCTKGCKNLKLEKINTPFRQSTTIELTAPKVER